MRIKTQDKPRSGTSIFYFFSRQKVLKPGPDNRQGKTEKTEAGRAAAGPRSPPSNRGERAFAAAGRDRMGGLGLHMHAPVGTAEGAPRVGRLLDAQIAAAADSVAVAGPSPPVFLFIKY